MVSSSTLSQFLVAAIAFASITATLPAEAAFLLPGGKNHQPESVAPPADLTPEEVEKFVAPLSDTESRQLLINTLKEDARSRQAAPESRSAGLLRSVEEGSARLSERRRAMLESLSSANRQFQNAFRNLTGGEGFPAFAKGGFVFVLMVALGLTAERVAGLKLGPIRRRLAESPERGRRRKLAVLGLKLLLDALSVLLFAFVGWAVSFLFFERFDPMRIFAIAYFAVITITRIVSVGSRALFAPHAGGLRLMDLSDDWALRLHRWTILVAAVGAFGFLTCSLLKLLGIDAHLHAFLLIVVEGAVTGLLVFMVWKTRMPVAAWLASSARKATPDHVAVATHGAEPEQVDDLEIAFVPEAELAQSELAKAEADTETTRSTRSFREVIAPIWHLIASGYLLGLWWFYSRDVMLGAVEASEAALLSLLLLLAIPVVDILLRALLEPDPTDPERSSNRLSVRCSRPIRTVARVGLVAWVAINLAEAAGLAVFGVMATPLGERINDALLDVSAALIIGYVLWELVKTAIERHMPQDEGGGAQIGEEGGSGKATRAATLLPLLRSFVLVVLVVMMTLIVLSSLGVNIGPLLAGAGVVGLAVGFGSQKLVQDIVAGIFFLVDDAFRVGEYIEAGGMKGTVESISIRSMRLRHHLGAVQTLPYGNIDSVKNHSRDWVTMKLEIRLPYDVDIEKVRKTIKKTGQKMLEHPEYGQHFLQPLKSQGVFRVEDSALIVRMKFTTVPNEQWVIRREAYRLVKEALAAQGIEFAHRQVFVNVPGDDKGEPGAAARAAGAAATAIEAAEQRAADTAATPTVDDR